MIGYDVSVESFSQLEAVLELFNPLYINRIYISMNIFLDDHGGLNTDIGEVIKKCPAEFFLSLPFMMREEEGLPAESDLETVTSSAESLGISGLLVRNLEELGFLLEKGYRQNVVLDHGLYIWNHKAIEALLFDENLKNMLVEYSMPLEQSIYEWKDTLKKDAFNLEHGICLYGRVPMMISAGCVKLDTEGCSGKKGDNYSETVRMTDRTGRSMPVTCQCRYCYNVIWNAHPLSLHKAYLKGMDIKRARYRIELTTEGYDETAAVLEFFLGLFDENSNKQPGYKEYTTGRFSKGVE